MKLACFHVRSCEARHTHTCSAVGSESRKEHDFTALSGNGVRTQLKREKPYINDIICIPSVITEQ